MSTPYESYRASNIHLSNGQQKHGETSTQTACYFTCNIFFTHFKQLRAMWLQLTTCSFHCGKASEPSEQHNLCYLWRPRNLTPSQSNVRIMQILGIKFRVIKPSELNIDLIQFGTYNLALEVYEPNGELQAYHRESHPQKQHKMRRTHRTMLFLVNQVFWRWNTPNMRPPQSHLYLSKSPQLLFFYLKGKNQLLDSSLLILTNSLEHAVHTIARINKFQYQIELEPAHFPFGVLCFANDYSISVSSRKVPRQLIQSTCSLPPKWKDEKGLLLSKPQAPLVLSTSSGVHQILLWASLIHYNSKLLSIFPGYFSAISVN